MQWNVFIERATRGGEVQTDFLQEEDQRTTKARNQRRCAPDHMPSILRREVKNLTIKMGGERAERRAERKKRKRIKEASQRRE